MRIVIVRSRRKTLSLSVNCNAEAVVRAPLFVKEEEIGRFVEKHRNWIEERIARLQKNRIDLANGAPLTLFGNTFSVACGRSAIKDGVIYLPEENREASLARLLKKISQMEMRERTRRFAEEFGFSFSAVRIGSARGRWGSCNKRGGVCYSFRVAFLPNELVDYIVVHELCHTRFFNHGAQFWREVEKILPDYKLRRKTLKKYSEVMNLL